MCEVGGGYLRFHGPVHRGRHLRGRVAIGVGGGLGAWRHWRQLRFGGRRLRRALDVLPVAVVCLRGGRGGADGRRYSGSKFNVKPIRGAEGVLVSSSCRVEDVHQQSTNNAEVT